MTVTILISQHIVDCVLGGYWDVQCGLYCPDEYGDAAIAYMTNQGLLIATTGSNLCTGSMLAYFIEMFK